MLQFTEDYFKKEMKDGFVISEVMKRVWAASLQVLHTIIQICDKHEITYYLYYGSLLGAVRHKGFIPWDDDIDIVMKRDDYIKFLDIAQQELPEGYSILNVYSRDGYVEQFTKVMNGDSVETWETRMNIYHDCPIAVGVDIFPFYYIPREKDLEEEQRILLAIIGQLATMLEHREKMERNGESADVILSYSRNIAKRLLEFQDVTGLKLEKGKNLKTQLGIMYDQICRLYSADESDELTLFPCYMSDGYKISKNLLDKTITMSFENMLVSAPAAYDEILKASYKDYMVPDKNSAEHTQFFLTGQLEEVLKKLRQSEMNFMIREKELPLEWKGLLEHVDEQGESVRKKIVLYAPSWVEVLCNGLSMDKLRSVLEFFEKRQNVLLWWFVEPLKSTGEEVIKRIAPQTFSEYQQIMTEYRQKGWGIYDDSCLAGRAITYCDVYYGDKGELYSRCEQAEKDLIIQSYEDANVDEYEW